MKTSWNITANVQTSSTQLEVHRVLHDAAKRFFRFLIYNRDFYLDFDDRNITYQKLRQQAHHTPFAAERYSRWTTLDKHQL